MMFDYYATVIKVIDGDTIDLAVDLGFHVGVSIRVRLMGVDAPEVSTAEGKVVRDRLRTELPIGTKVEIHTEKYPGDKYGRWLARVSGPTGDLAEWLLTQDMAKPYSGGAR